MTRPWQQNLRPLVPAPDPIIQGHEVDGDGTLTTTAILSDGRLVQWVTAAGAAGRVDPVELARHLEASTPAPTAAHRQVG